MFYKVLQYSIGKCLDIGENFILFYFFLDCSIYISEQITNFKHKKHQERLETFKIEYIYVINYPT